MGDEERGSDDITLKFNLQFRIINKLICKVLSGKVIRVLEVNVDSVM